jgi:DNA invertase Pin-like site-specific DNA recombinase
VVLYLSLEAKEQHMQNAVAYLRTSSATNVGSDKDSERRQTEAINAFAERAGFAVVQSFNDAAVRGTDAIDARGGFSALLCYCAEHDVKTIIVENASRFARDLIVQETGYAALKRAGFTLIASDDPDSFTADTATAVMVRQILGSVSQFEKSNLVAKLRGARDRKSALLGRRCEVRHGYDLTRPELVAEAQALNDGRTLRAISAELASRGYVTAKAGKAFSPSQVQRLLNYTVAATVLLDGVRSDAAAYAAI